MRHLLFALLLLLCSCAQERATVVEQLFPTDMTQEAAITLGLLSLNQLVEVLPDTCKTVQVERTLYIPPCDATTVTYDMDEAPRQMSFTKIDCELLKGPWEATYVWVLVDKPDTKQWVRCPALLRPGASSQDKVVVAKASVRTNPDGYGADLLVQQN